MISIKEVVTNYFVVYNEEGVKEGSIYNKRTAITMFLNEICDNLTSCIELIETAFGITDMELQKLFLLDILFNEKELDKFAKLYVSKYSTCNPAFYSY